MVGRKCLIGLDTLSGLKYSTGEGKNNTRHGERR